jgi:hypothetical protein
MDKQRVFIGSSTEMVSLARRVEGELSGLGFQIDAWYHFGGWPLGSSTLVSLEDRLSQCDFGVFILGAEDLAQSRNTSARPAPRDNILFELGLSMGRLGKQRSFFFFPTIADFKSPSDLFGVTALPYPPGADPDEIRGVVSRSCTLIGEQINHVVDVEYSTLQQVVPELTLRVSLPAEDGATEDRIGRLRAAQDAKITFIVKIEDRAVDGLRVYFNPRLKLRRSGWRCDRDSRGIYFWAAPQQVADMKHKSTPLGFAIEGSRKGKSRIDVVATVEGQPRYSKTFVVVTD